MLDVTIQYFWLIQVFILLVIMGSMYKSIVKYKFKSKIWNFITIVLIVLFFVQPVKLEPETKKQNNLMNEKIEKRNKESLPELKKDDSFKEKSKNVQGITEENLK